MCIGKKVRVKELKEEDFESNEEYLDYKTIEGKEGTVIMYNATSNWYDVAIEHVINNRNSEGEIIGSYTDPISRLKEHEIEIIENDDNNVE